MHPAFVCVYVITVGIPTNLLIQDYLRLKVACELVVTSDPVTSVTNARAPSPRLATAKELAGVTAMFGKLHIRPASLEPKKGNWAYRKTSPSPEDLPTADESYLWDGFRNLQEPANEDSDEFPLADEEGAQISCLVCGAPFPGDSLPAVSLGSLGHHVT